MPRILQECRDPTAAVVCRAAAGARLPRSPQDVAVPWILQECRGHYRMVRCRGSYRHAAVPWILQQCRGHYSKKNIGLTARGPTAAVLPWILQQCRGVPGCRGHYRLPWCRGSYYPISKP